MLLPLVDEQEPVRPVTASFGQPPFERIVVAGDLLPRAHVARQVERRHRSAVGRVGDAAIYPQMTSSAAANNTIAIFTSRTVFREHVTDFMPQHGKQG